MERFIRARVTEESFEGWRRFCDFHGITTSALVEALGLLLQERTGAEDLSHYTVRIVGHAREIDAERRRRDGD